METTDDTGHGNGHATATARREGHASLPPQHDPPLALPPADGARPQPMHHNVPRLNDPDQPSGHGHWWVWLIVLFVLAAVAIFLVPKVIAKLKAPPPAAANAAGGKGGAGREVPVVAEVVRKGQIKIYLDGLGTVTPYSTVTLRSRVDGQIMKINFKEGQVVKAGDSIMEIDTRPYEVLLTQAQGSIAKDAAQLTSAKQDLQRYVEAGSSVSVQQVEQQKALVAQAEGAVKTDQGQIDSAKLNITYCHITSPIGGRIGLRIVDEGNIIHASDASGLVVITQMQPIAVAFSLPQDDIPRVIQQKDGGAGLPALAFNRDLTGQPIASGTLLAADSQVDQTTGTLKFKAAFPNEDNTLFPNQFVNVKLLVQTLDGVTIAPNAAVQQGPDSQYAYVVKDDNTVELRTIETGEREGDRTVITKGLEPGDKVVTDGLDKLVNGTKVSAKPPGARPGKNGAATKPAGMTRGGKGGASQPVEPATTGASGR